MLQNGKVLVAGGSSDGSVLSSLRTAELYDPRSGTWTLTGSMAAARWGDYTATLLSNGRVLVVGGMGNGPRLVEERADVKKSAELYDPLTGTWSSTANLGIFRAGHTATLLSNGEVLIAGGFGRYYDVTRSAELYDPASGSWRPTGDLITELIGVQQSSATLLPNGKVLVAGGYDGERGAGGPTKLTQLYDPVSGTWSLTGGLNSPRAGHTATLLSNGEVLIVGGWGNINSTAELYNPVSGTWSLTGSPSSGFNISTATLLPNGQVLTTDGVRAAELYDPVSGTWSPTGGLSTARSGFTVALLHTGMVLEAGDTGATPIAELYTPFGVADVLPPKVSCSVSPTRLWPPNGKLVPVQVTVLVTDPGGSGPNGYKLIAITSNQGSIANEQQGFVIGTSSTSGQLLAQRDGNGTSRVYTLTYQGSDVAGNTATCTATVTVPHDRGH